MAGVQTVIGILNGIPELENNNKKASCNIIKIHVVLQVNHQINDPLN